MFSVGDVICYPMYGVGTVEGIVSQTVLKITADYYSLRFLNDKVSALVPVASAEKIGMRSLIDISECERVIEYMKQPGNRGSDNWNQRYRDNMEKMKSGNIYSVADVVKCLRIRNEEKGLSSGEKKLYATALLIIIGELATVMNLDNSVIEERIA